VSSAIKPITRKITLASPSITLAAATGFPDLTWIRFTAVRAARTNQGDVFWSDEGGQPGGYVGPGEAATYDYGEGQAFMGQVVLSGTIGDVVYLTVGVNRQYFDRY
jgi:hypothetical protein